MDRDELPLGFSFALAQNPDAMMRFSSLTESEQARILRLAHNALTKDEMQALVERLSAQ